MSFRSYFLATALNQRLVGRDKRAPLGGANPKTSSHSIVQVPSRSATMGAGLVIRNSSPARLPRSSFLLLPSLTSSLSWEHFLNATHPHLGICLGKPNLRHCPQFVGWKTEAYSVMKSFACPGSPREWLSWDLTPVLSDSRVCVIYIPC